MHNLIILKKEFPYAPELDLFLDSIMRSLTTTIFKIIVTLHGIKFWYHMEVFTRSLGIPLSINRN